MNSELDKNKIAVWLLEYHVTNSCNLACVGCNHYTHILKGNNKQPKELDADLASWGPRLNIKQFHLLGGEPFAHRRLLEFCKVARGHLATSKIDIVTNGLLINRVPNLDFLGRRLSELNVGIKLTVHSQNPAYQQKIQKVIEILKNLEETYGVRLKVRNHSNSWGKRFFEDENGVISPYNDKQPEQSWNSCICKPCRQLIDGKIYKCPQIAYLQDMKKINKTSTEFDTYLKYKPISPDVSDSELRERFEMARSAESICGMCPANQEFINDAEKNSRNNFK